MDLPNDPESLAPIAREAQFYQVSGLIDLIHSRKGRRRRARLTREAVLTMVNLSSSGLLGASAGESGPMGVQLPSTNLSGMDLSYLKMPHAALVNRRGAVSGSERRGTTGRRLEPSLPPWQRHKLSPNADILPCRLHHFAHVDASDELYPPRVATSLSHFGTPSLPRI